MGKFVAVLLAVFLALAAAGGGMGAKLDSSRPDNVDAYQYYVNALNATEGAERAKIALAYEWAEATGAITEEQYNALEELYKSRKGE